jgi:hypothetical protein
MALELNGTTGVSLVQNGVLTDANLPAGSVLQMVATDLATTTISDSNTGTGATVWGSTTITPLASGNYILAFVSGSCQYGTACLGESSAYITYSASGVSETVSSQITSGNETSSLRTYDGFGLVAKITTSTTNTYTIRVRANGRDVNATARSVTWAVGRLILMEIAA